MSAPTQFGSLPPSSALGQANTGTKVRSNRLFRCWLCLFFFFFVRRESLRERRQPRVGWQWSLAAGEAGGSIDATNARGKRCPSGLGLAQRRGGARTASVTLFCYFALLFGPVPPLFFVGWLVGSMIVRSDPPWSCGRLWLWGRWCFAVVWTWVVGFRRGGCNCHRGS